MDKGKELLIEAQAHLYVGIAKSDGVIDNKEFSQIPYYAEKSQRFFKLLKLSDEEIHSIGTTIRSFIGKYNSLNADDHLQMAKELLQKAKELGVWQHQILFTKNEQGFLDSAKIGGYFIKESAFLSKIEDMLKSL